MNKNLMKRCAPLGLVALLAISCFKPMDDVQSRYEAYVQVRYEPTSYSDLPQFLSDFFKGGTDSVSVTESFYYGPVYHYAKLDEAGGFGGFAMCIGMDTLVTPDRRPAPLAVCAVGGNSKSMGYAVFHDTLSVLMPEHDVLVYIPNDESTAKPHSVFVQNTHAVVEAVKYGVGLADGPFKEGDWMDLTFKGSFKGNPSGEKKVRLVDGTRLLDKWTEVDLSDMTKSDALDLSITCSRPDMPLYAALDDLCFYYLEIY